MMIGDRPVSHVGISRLAMRIGAAVVLVDGIGPVWTEEDHRLKGYARRLMEAAVRRMEEGDAALSFLEGISDFYPKFGFATAGPLYHLHLTELSHEAPLPAGWRVRSLLLQDLPAVRHLYEQNTEGAVGAAVRPVDGRVWSQVAEASHGVSGDECRVVTDPDGQVKAYAWRGKGLDYVHLFEGYGPDSLVLAEVMADGPISADAILAVCRQWGQEESKRRPRPVEWVYTSLPPGGPVTTAAMYQAAELKAQYFRCGGPMLRLLSVERLLRSLSPELTVRLRASRQTMDRPLRIETDLGNATLRMTAADLQIEPGVGEPGRTTPDGDVDTLRISQQDLGRLALGGFPPDAILNRLDPPPAQAVKEVIQSLFPGRPFHLYLPDRP